MTKRNLLRSLFILILVAVFPVTAYATVFSMSDTDIHITIDDSRWYVFTRDNIKDNPELEALGVSYDYLNGIFVDNNAYLDAILIQSTDSFMELLIRKNPMSNGAVNMANYSEKEIMELAEQLAEQQNVEDYSIYETGQPFIRMDYHGAEHGYYLCEFITFVNKESYTLTFQSLTPYTDSDYQEITQIVDSVSFDVDTTLREKKTESLSNRVIRDVIIGAISGGIFGLVAAAKKRKNKDATEPVETK